MQGETPVKVAKTDNPTDHLVGVKVGPEFVDCGPNIWGRLATSHYDS